MRDKLPYNVCEIKQRLSGFGLYKGSCNNAKTPAYLQAIKHFQSLYPPLPITGIADSDTLQHLFPQPIKDRDFYTKELNRQAYCTPKQFSYPFEQDVPKYFGEPTKQQIKLVLPYPMRLAWDLTKQIEDVVCHALVAKNLYNLLMEVYCRYGLDSIKNLGLDIFGGCYNMRMIRGGRRLSTHSWGIAFDIDPANNQLTMNHKQARLAGEAYKDFWLIVEKHGAVSIGRERDYDWSHFQFCRV